ncbi:membrane protein insertase YidC [Dyella halodurans]|uniref:YidC/Oxa1 family membrane protein insertase n=1 Tax=Dyella halodurans TaxID=1920171 RepID=A0ABV9C215_9GAMM|nr:membrane protein insertase YidC [Dyella halodurans]
MALWNSFVALIAQVLDSLAHGLNGSYGMAVIALALMVRLVLLPWTLRAAEHAWRQRQAMTALKPKLEQLAQRHADDPMAHAAAMRTLYREHGLGVGMGGGLLTAMVQAPLGLGVYAAIRQGLAGAGAFLWIPKLARPDLWLAALVAALSYAAILLNPAMSAQAKTLLQWLPVVISFFVVWHLAAGLGLYWAASSGVNLLQSVLLRRRIRTTA